MITNYPKNGKDGITPHIGSNNNWFIGNEDTGIRASGQSSTEIISVVIAPDDWNTETNQVIIDCQGVSINEEEQVVTLSPALSSKETCTACEIKCVACNDDMLTLQAVTLPTEEVTIYVAITKANSTQDNSVQNNVYSTEETVVGTWIDGKPVYRVSIYVVIPPRNSNNDSPIYVPCLVGIDKLISFDGSLHHGGAGSRIFQWGDALCTFVHSTSDYGGIILKASSDAYVGSEAVYTVEYTKLSDTATINIPSATALADAYEEGVNEA